MSKNIKIGGEVINGVSAIRVESADEEGVLIQFPDEGGTVVYVNGQPVETFDADTKLDKQTSATSFDQVYTKAANGTQKLVPATASPGSGRIPTYLSNGQLACNNPTADGHAVNKGFADNNYTGKRYLHSIKVEIDDGVKLFDFVVQVVNASSTAITDGRHIFDSGNFVSVHGLDEGTTVPIVAPVLTMGIGYAHSDIGAAVVLYDTDAQTWRHFNGLSSNASGVSACSLVDTVTAF